MYEDAAAAVEFLSKAFAFARSCAHSLPTTAAFGMPRWNSTAAG